MKKNKILSINLVEEISKAQELEQCGGNYEEGGKRLGTRGCSWPPL